MMPGLNRSLRTHSLSALAGMLLGLAGLATVGVESVTSGHGHLGHGRAFRHHHLFSGAHEHPGHHDDPEEAPAGPASEKRGTPRKSATVAAAPALLQPAGVALPPAPREIAALLGLVLALLPVLQPALRLAGPRAPPLSAAVPDSLD